MYIGHIIYIYIHIPTNHIQSYHISIIIYLNKIIIKFNIHHWLPFSTTPISTWFSSKTHQNSKPPFKLKPRSKKIHTTLLKYPRISFRFHFLPQFSSWGQFNDFNVIFYVHSMYYSDYRMDTTRFFMINSIPCLPSLLDFDARASRDATPQGKFCSIYSSDKPLDEIRTNHDRGDSGKNTNSRLIHIYIYTY